jgi:hypothetical protein
VRLSTGGAAAWFAKVELSAVTRGALAGRGAEATESFDCRRGRERNCAPAAPIQPPRECPMTFVRLECGLRHQPAPQLHR